MISDSHSAAPATAHSRTSILVRLYEALDRLPTALGRIAKYVIEHPEKVVRLSVTEIGEFSGTGEASVVRLCQLLGFSGFRDFKLALAGELARPAAIDRGHAEVAGELADLHRTMRDAVDAAASGIDAEQIRAVAMLLCAAKRIDLYGAGVSGIIAELLAYRLLRLRLTAQAFRDVNMAHEVANGLDARCVAVAVSESGLTPDTLQFIKAAKSAGASTIAVTNRAGSPVAQCADVVLRVMPGHRPAADAIVSAPARILLVEAIGRAIASLMATE